MLMDLPIQCPLQYLSPLIDCNSMSAGTCIDYLIQFEFGDGCTLLACCVANDATRKDDKMNERFTHHARWKNFHL